MCDAGDGDGGGDGHVDNESNHQIDDRDVYIRLGADYFWRGAVYSWDNFWSR